MKTTTNPTTTDSDSTMTTQELFSGIERDLGNLGYEIEIRTARPTRYANDALVARIAVATVNETPNVIVRADALGYVVEVKGTWGRAGLQILTGLIEDTNDIMRAAFERKARGIVK